MLDPPYYAACWQLAPTGQTDFARFNASRSVKRPFLVFDRSVMTASQKSGNSNSSGNRKDSDS